MGRLLEALKRRRWALDDRLTERGLAHTFSLARFRLHGATGRLLDREARGDCLDIGSGRSPFKRRLAGRGCRVTSVDVEDRAGEVDLIADVQDLEPIADASFDTVICTQVLEHVERPARAMAEMARVLRPGGRLILTTPHLSHVHEAPHDFFRYTRFGLDSLAATAGLETREIEATGGIVCFLAHGLSLALMSTLGAVPGLAWATWALNYLFLVRVAGLFDRIFGLPGLYPCDLVLLATRPGSGAGEG